MIELFTRRALDLAVGVHLSPLPAGEDISSLSAILLEDDYYKLVLDFRVTIGGIPAVPAGCLIPLKARAWLDLTSRKAAGHANVAEADIKKHRNDVFRLLVTLAPADRVQVPEAVRKHLCQFAAGFPVGAPEWPAIRQAVKDLPGADVLLVQLSEVFMLGDG
jgi:hypothetical protein